MLKPRPLNYLVTGGAGFIGSHLAERLLAHGHTVNVLDDLSTGRVENISHLFDLPAFQFTHASLFDEIVLDRLASQADVIVHLAAAVGVQLIVERPVHTIETNVMGTETVLKAAMRRGCRVLIASSSEVYGKGLHFPFTESDDVLLGPTSKSRWAYAASKMIDEFLGLAYLREYDLPVVIVRLFNTVGARQTGRYGMVLPRFVQQALGGMDLTVYGDGSQSRSFCDVRDVIEALEVLTQHPAAPGQVYNLGSLEETTILELARTVIHAVGSPSSIVFVPYDQAYAPGFEDMQRRLPDLSRIHALTGWQPAHSFSQILVSVIAYERQQLSAGHAE